MAIGLKLPLRLGVNIKNAWSRESKSHGECAVIVLSKTDNVERDHLIHRKRSPFPYEGKALTPLNGSIRPRSGSVAMDIASQAPPLAVDEVMRRN